MVCTLGVIGWFVVATMGWLAASAWCNAIDNASSCGSCTNAVCESQGSCYLQPSYTIAYCDVIMGANKAQCDASNVATWVVSDAPEECTQGDGAAPSRPFSASCDRLSEDPCSSKATSPSTTNTGCRVLGDDDDDDWSSACDHITGILMACFFTTVFTIIGSIMSCCVVCCGNDETEKSDSG
jgi:hypothetical protein